MPNSTDMDAGAVPISQNTASTLELLRFDLESFLLVTPDDKVGFELLKAIGSIRVTCNYDSEQVFPAVRVTANLTVKELVAMQKGVDSGVVIVRMVKHGDIKAKDPSQVGASQDVPREFWQNLAFKVVQFDHRTPPGRHAEADTSKDADSQRVYQIEFGMILQSHLDMSRKKVDEVFADTDTAAVMAYLMTNSYDGKSKFLVSQPENTEVFEQVMFAEANMRDWIYHLDQAYGIYRRGMRIWFDFDANYVLSRDPAMSVFRKDEYKAVSIEVVDPHDTGHDWSGGLEDDAKGKRWFTRVQGNAVKATMLGNGAAEVSGSVLIVVAHHPTKGKVFYKVDVSDPSSATEIDNAAASTLINESRKSGRVRTVYSEFGQNRFVAEQVAETIRERGTTLTIEMDGVDPSVLTYNKRFPIRFTNRDMAASYDGLYNISGLEYAFTSPNGKDGTASYACVLVAHFKRYSEK
jgi:hypothetical protein